jgi:hypothetical protein
MGSFAKRDLQFSAGSLIIYFPIANYPLPTANCLLIKPRIPQADIIIQRMYIKPFISHLFNKFLSECAL